MLDSSHVRWVLALFCATAGFGATNKALHLNVMQSAFWTGAMLALLITGVALLVYYKRGRIMAYPLWTGLCVVVMLLGYSVGAALV